MPRPQLEEDARRRNITFSAGPATLAMVQAIRAFYALTEPNSRWSDGRALDQIVERQFFGIVTEKLAERFGARLQHWAHDFVTWRVGDRVARVTALGIDGVTVHEADGSRAATVIMYMQIPNVIEMLTGFFNHGLGSASTVYPSYENLVDGMPVVINVVNLLTGESRVLQSLAEPEADPPVVGSMVTVFVSKDETVAGTVKAAEVLEMRGGDREGKSLFISLSQGDPFRPENNDKMNATDFFHAINTSIASYIDAASISAQMTTEFQSSWTRGAWQVRSLQLESGDVRFFFFNRPEAGDPLPIQRIVPPTRLGVQFIAPDIGEFLLTGSTAPHRFWATESSPAFKQSG